MGGDGVILKIIENGIQPKEDIRFEIVSLTSESAIATVKFKGKISFFKKVSLEIIWMLLIDFKTGLVSTKKAQFPSILEPN